MTLTQAQRARLRALESASGQLTPSAVVKDAKRRASPLHGLFDWQTARAAEKWWLHRAREIIGAVDVVTTTETSTIRAPVYVHVPDTNQQHYQRVERLKSNPALARESLIYILDTAAGHVRRALDLAAPLGMQGEVDALLVEIVGLQRRILPAA